MAAPSARRGRRRPLSTLLGTLGILAAAVLVAYGGYRAGLAEGRAERERLRTELQRAREQVRILEERGARTAQRLDALHLAYRELERRYRERAIEGELEEVLVLLRRKLAEGVPLARLRFLVENAAVERRCGESERARLYVRVPLARDRRAAATLAGGVLTLAAEGEPARDEEGRPEAWYDPLKPVRVRILRLDGRSEELEGPLPLARELLVGNAVYRLVLAPDPRRGWLEVTVQRCDAAQPR
ncbi:hypothetical protein HRbin39_01039 [bacterium HR39]|nr:hypothetical protein HRbin39_01039 [bacterium HR39]